MQDEQLKKYKKKLEAAINGALLESPQINDAIQGIRQTGHEVFLIIEATIGFNQRESGDSVSKKLPPVHLKLTTQDEKFLKSLKISPD